MIDATRLHDGCIAYDAAEDVFEPGVIRISEMWPDHQSLQRHIDAPYLPAWFSAVRNCGVLESKFTIFDVTGARVV